VSVHCGTPLSPALIRLILSLSIVFPWRPLDCLAGLVLTRNAKIGHMPVEHIEHRHDIRRKRLLIVEAEDVLAAPNGADITLETPFQYTVRCEHP
jgi:hypothetical protein